MRSHDDEDQARLLAEAIARPEIASWLPMAQRVDGCEHPVRLVGRSIKFDVRTGEVLSEFSTAESSPAYVMVACGNRRASRCEPCSRLYKGDTFQLVRAGLMGGKGVPEAVRTHPRLFVTLTAPSFGPVHAARTRADGRPSPCRPRRDGRVCMHGRALSCRARHQGDDPLVGQPLCAQCYDYPGAVLWNAHAGQLWRRTTIYLRDEMARHAGLSRTALGRQMRLSYVKVAEFQARGLVHFHILFRLDGADGPTTAPPAWADLELLAESVQEAVSRVRLPTSDLSGAEIAWGSQVDVRAVIVADEEGYVSERAVASYLAKYATKAAEASGTVDRPIKSAGEIGALRVSDHVRAMISTAWRLGGRREYGGLGLRRWAHMLGYGGHFSTKSRAYSTTLTALRQVRSDHRASELNPATGGDATAAVATDGQWSYIGQGYLSEGEAAVAATFRERGHRRQGAEPQSR